MSILRLEAEYWLLKNGDCGTWEYWWQMSLRENVFHLTNMPTYISLSSKELCQW